MQLLVDQFETFAGAILQPAQTPIDDDEFLALCHKYPGYRIESTAEGDIVIMPPTHPRTGQGNALITHQLVAWAEQDGRGEVFDSSAGFFLANGARRSPDSAWIAREKLKGLEDAALWRVTPDFVIELKSASDRSATLQAKMREWIANGCALGWLIVPETRLIEIYRADSSMEQLGDAVEVCGEGPVAGFRLSLDRIWRGI